MLTPKFTQGTSTTFLMSTPHYKPDQSVHFMNHPTTPGLYMFMLCYKNGGLARENVRNSLALATAESSWSVFDDTASSSPFMGQQREGSPIKMGLYFPRPEIVPNVCIPEPLIAAVVLFWRLNLQGRLLKRHVLQLDSYPRMEILTLISSTGSGWYLALQLRSE